MSNNVNKILDHFSLPYPSAKKQKMSEVETIKKILECPICLLTPRGSGPINQCTNGHMICNDCHHKVTLCPICRTDQINVPLHPLLKQILSSFIRPCSNVDKGCQEKLNESDMKNHEKKCAFRSIDCFFCEKNFVFDDIINHLNEKHDMKDYNENGFALTEKNFKNPASWIPLRKESNGRDFILYIKKSQEDIFFVKCFFLGSKAESANYLCEMTLKKKGTEKHFLKFNGDVIPLENLDTSSNDNIDTFMFSGTMARKFMENGRIYVSLNLEKKN